MPNEDLTQLQLIAKAQCLCAELRQLTQLTHVVAAQSRALLKGFEHNISGARRQAIELQGITRDHIGDSRRLLRRSRELSIRLGL